jgi:hypothetical protein
VKRARADVEEDWKERLKSAERRSAEDLEELRMEIVAAKRRQEDAQREADAARRKVVLSKEDGKQEASTELESARKAVQVAEEQLRVQTTELRKLREDHIVLASKLSSAMQMTQVGYTYTYT